MFTRVQTVEKKEQVIQDFKKIDGHLQLLIATSAFGMVIDCPDIRRVIHWGLPSTVEEYVQEAGRCGRDGAPSEAVLFEAKGPSHADDRILEYVSETTGCRRIKDII